MVLSQDQEPFSPGQNTLFHVDPLTPMTDLDQLGIKKIEKYPEINSTSLNFLLFYGH